MLGTTLAKAVRVRLTLTEAAELLGTGEAEVEALVVRSALPAFKMHDRLWVNRTDLLEWAASRGVRFSRRVYSHGASNLSSALARGGTHELPAPSLDAALAALVDRLPLPPDVDRAELRDILLVRDPCAPTVVAPGVLIPHARMPVVLEVDEPLLALGYFQEPLQVGTASVRAVFLLVTPTVRAHLHLLARLARVLHDPTLCGAIERRDGLERLLQLVADADEPVSVR